LAVENDRRMSSRTATLTGLGAVALWSLLALFTAATGKVPPFQLAAMTFAIAGVFGIAIAAARGRLRQARPRRAGLALGLYGLFGDTALYFAALKLAPPAEANLVHYLWPLLIVLFAALLPGGRLQPRHLIGAVMGLAASALLVGGRFGGEGTNAPLGFLLAGLGAFVWASYSVASRRLAHVPTETVAVTCLAAALLAALIHLLLEITLWPATLTEWLAVVGLGLGPIGAAFFLWDIGMKRGDVPLLGVASYAAPVLSTLTLVLTGYAEPTAALAVSCALIVAGALMATFSPRATAVSPGAYSDRRR
jgi:drug/metabolite transporter (DMT)-like permease